MLFLIIRANKAQNKIECNTATQLFTDMEGCKCYIYNNGHKQSQQIKMIGCQCYLQLLFFCNLYFLNISTQNELSNTYLKEKSKHRNLFDRMYAYIVNSKLSK